MRRAAMKPTATIALLLLSVFGLLAARPAISATCSEGTGVPPFLGVETVTANLLLMIDNSYSMYDLVYAETRDECFDDSFNPAVFKYAGYFLTIDDLFNDREIWYEYDTSPGKRRTRSSCGGPRPR